MDGPQTECADARAETRERVETGIGFVGEKFAAHFETLGASARGCFGAHRVTIGANGVRAEGAGDYDDIRAHADF
ncbi:hypothetical protein YK56LOC_58040 [Caballeronia sp. HLA56]